MTKPKTKLEYIEYFKQYGIVGKLPEGESLSSMYNKIEQYKKLKLELKPITTNLVSK